MSELANKIKGIRGQLNADQAGDKCGISRESFYRIERGGSVKLETVRAIATGFGLAHADWLDLLIAWLKHEAQADAQHLFIEKRDSGPSRLQDSESHQMAAAMILFENLNPNDREQILRAMQRPEVRGCLPAINRVWEKFDTDKPPVTTYPVNSAKVDAMVDQIVKHTVDSVRKSSKPTP